MKYTDLKWIDLKKIKPNNNEMCFVLSCTQKAELEDVRWNHEISIGKFEPGCELMEDDFMDEELQYLNARYWHPVCIHDERILKG